jgi:hypothetical protein
VRRAFDGGQRNEGRFNRLSRRRHDLQLLDVFPAEDGGRVLVLVGVVEAVLGEVVDAEDPGSRLRPVLDEPGPELEAGLLQLLLVVQLKEFLRRLDRFLPKKLESPQNRRSWVRAQLYVVYACHT